jgi:N-acyl amino acid synthase of PEP-CTERM/exosortase system
MAAVSRMTVDHGVTHWFAGMEPVLNRLLSRFSLQLTPVGPLFSYPGMPGVRQPYLNPVQEVMDRAYGRHRDVWVLLTQNGKLLPPAKELRKGSGTQEASLTLSGRY